MGLFSFKSKENSYLPLEERDLPTETNDSDNHMIEKAIGKVFSYDVKSDEFNKEYNDFLRELYNLPYIYIALSPSKFNKTGMDSEPVILTKDNNVPTIYIFSTLNRAKVWADYYKYYNDEGYLIGILYKNRFDFESVYRLAYSIGVLRVMLDEGGRYINFSISEMIKVNNISEEIKYSLNEQQYKHLNMNKGIPLPRCRIVKKGGL